MQQFLKISVVLTLALAGCSVKYNNPDYEYPPSAVQNTDEWPELVNTKRLAAKASQPTEADKRAVENVEARAEALRARAQSTPAPSNITSARAERLRQRALGTRPQGISEERINRLRERAAALKAAPI